MLDCGGAGLAAGTGLSARLQASAPIALDMDLACAPGEVLALVGPSGAGKSTALRCVAGLHRPQAGVVRCGGSAWLDTAAGLDVPPHRRAVGLVFQDYALFPHMTALGNVMAAMGHRPRGAREERARELLALVRLAGLEARRPAELSGGQQQRVAVARALVAEPTVLFADEPTGNLDSKSSADVLALLRDAVSAYGQTIVMVTHDENAADAADRVIHMVDGRVEEQS
jgi:molybdate transport system ATP-binding protein